MESLTLITPAAIEPIALSDFMNFARIDADADVITMGAIITAAREEAEKITRRQLITATWEYRLDKFPGASWPCALAPQSKLVPGAGDSQTIYLPMPPLQTVSTLKYLDYAGTEQTLVENTDYLVDTYSLPARITPAYGYVWPVTYPVMGAVRIRFVAGYGDDETDVPQSIRNWIMAFAGSLYENRETDIVANITQALTKLKFLDGLLDNYRVFGKE